MKVDTIICYYDEIALKGRNRRKYEDMLMSHIRTSLKPFDSVANVIRFSGRIVVELRKEKFKDEKTAVFEALATIFGIAYFTPTYTILLDIEEMKKSSLSLINQLEGDTFKITTRRSNKKFPLTSVQVSQEVGGYVFERVSKKVRLTKPDINCVIDIVEKRAYISAERHAGVRGLPVGSAGSMLAMLSGGIDSPVAAFYMLKRGATLTFVHFHNYPYTTQASINKVVELAQILTKYQPKIKLYLIPFSDVQNKIALNCPEKLRIILYRRFMYYIAEKIAKKDKLKSLITGEALGQVASQTIENITATDDAITIPVMRPLIGFDKCEIIQKAKEIESYETSIRPHEDCCTRFVPKHPETRAKMKEVHAAEKLLDVKTLVEEALEKIETKEVLYIHND